MARILTELNWTKDSETICFIEKFLYSFKMNNYAVLQYYSIAINIVLWCKHKVKKIFNSTHIMLWRKENENCNNNFKKIEEWNWQHKYIRNDSILRLKFKRRKKVENSENVLLLSCHDLSLCSSQTQDIVVFMLIENVKMDLELEQFPRYHWHKAKSDWKTK